MSDELPRGPYSVILADPPWQYNDKSMHRGGAERHYSTLSMRELFDLDVRGMAAANAVLFLWVTGPFAADGWHGRLMRQWSFTPKTKAFNWVKITSKGEPAIGMGHYTRGNSEDCYLGIRGKGLIRQARDVRQIVLAPRSAHSAKPPEVHERIERLYGNVKRVELFARRRVPGWDAWGDGL